jgi:hypothetical protein
MQLGRRKYCSRPSTSHVAATTYPLLFRSPITLLRLVALVRGYALWRRRGVHWTSRTVTKELIYSCSNFRFYMCVIFMTNYSFSRWWYPVDSNTLLVIDFVNLKIKSTQPFRVAHIDKICVHVFIKISAHIYIYISTYICIVFLTKKKVQIPNVPTPVWLAPASLPAGPRHRLILSSFHRPAIRRHCSENTQTHSAVHWWVKV